MSITQLVYASTPVGAALTPEFFNTRQLLNRSLDVNGMIVVAPDCYIQLLEGTRVAVNKLFAIIAKDPRHTDLTLLRYAEVRRREFHEWDLLCITADEMLANPLLANYVQDKSAVNLNGTAVLNMIRRIATSCQITP